MFFYIDEFWKQSDFVMSDTLLVCCFGRICVLKGVQSITVSTFLHFMTSLRDNYCCCAVDAHNKDVFVCSLWTVRQKAENPEIKIVFKNLCV